MRWPLSSQVYTNPIFRLTLSCRAQRSVMMDHDCGSEWNPESNLLNPPTPSLKGNKSTKLISLEEYMYMVELDVLIKNGIDFFIHRR